MTDDMPFLLRDLDRAAEAVHNLYINPIHQLLNEARDVVRRQQNVIDALEREPTSLGEGLHIG